jgi:hypothetical protein
MQKKLTWFLTGLALALFAFIYFVERKVPGTAERGTAPRILATVEAQDVTALEITLAGGGTVRAEQTNGTWFLTKPLYPAQQSAINTFVTNVVRLRSFDKLEQHDVVLQGQKSFGLEPPRATVQIETATNRYKLEIGGDAPFTNNIYVRLAPSAEVLLTEAQVLKSLPRTTNDWRSENLLQLATLPFDHLQLRVGQRVVELGRNPTNGAWQITKPIPARADQQQIAVLLDQIGRAQVGDFVADGVVDLERYGLQTPEVELGLSQGTNRLFTVQFGGSATNGTNQVFARLLGNTNLVTVSRELVDFLKQPYKAFHDPRLLTLENLPALDRVGVKFLEEFAVQRQPDGRWRVESAGGFPADLELLGEFLSKMLALRILDIVKEVPTEADMQALGLQKPLARYSFYHRQTNASGTVTNVLSSELSFGTNTADRIYVSRSDETPIYITEFAKFLELPRFAYELRDRQIWNVSTANVVRVSLVSAAGTNTATRTGAAWTSEPLANEAIGEAVFRLSNLKALRWVAMGDERKRSLGIGPEGEILELEVKGENGTEVRRIPLGKLTMRRDVYAEHPEIQTLIFEFPGEIYHLLKQNLPAAK